MKRQKLSTNITYEI